MSYVSTVLADGALGLYELGEASGTVAVDQCGNQNGTYSGTVTFGQPGIPGGGGATAALFAGGSVAVVDNASQRFADVFTVELWLKLTTTGVLYGLFGGDNSRIFRLSTTGTFFLSKQAVADVMTSTGTITDTTTWHHIVFTKNGSTRHCYLDGVEGTTLNTNETFADPSGTHHIAGDGTSPNVHGTMAMVAWYATELTPTQVSMHWALGSGGFAPANSGFLMLL